MRKNRHSRLVHTAISDINLTNLIDVIMVVLVIYILIAPLVEQGINVNLPEASPHRIEPTESITVTISEEGKIYLENTQLTLSQLKEQLAYSIKKKPDTGVIIKGDKELKYGTLINVLDELNNAGITKVGMATELKK